MGDEATAPEAQIHPVILCGGAGTRLWPLSRRSFPKQFSPLAGAASLLEQTARRLDASGFAPPLAITAEPFRFVVQEQLSAAGVQPAAVLVEPEPRNTAPAVLAAALWLQRTASDGLILVAPSDHAIPDAAAFRAAVAEAVPRARAGDLVAFGIAPSRPETGYGYLEVAEGAAGGGGVRGPIPLKRFVEKPDLHTAREMFESGRFLWNAGIFLFSVEAICAAYRAHAPEMFGAVSRALQDAEPDLGFTRLAASAWAEAEAISIDYAIMEKATGLSAMPYSGKWSDLGDWNAVWQEGEPDGAGNVVSFGASAIDCAGTLLRSEAEGVALVGLGLRDIVAVAMPDAVLVADRGDAQRVKEAVVALKAQGAVQAERFPREHRPWGWFESLVMGERFQVKRITVKPGGSLSLQSHHHRSEHWVVVAGTARVTLGEEVRLVPENESVYIPVGTVHRLENPGKLPLVLIEVQTGAYLGEDDIIRYADEYARR